MSASDFAACSAPCRQCVERYDCPGCEFWPIYPCFSSRRPIVDCVSAYDNDRIAVDDPEDSNTAVNMYETLLREGHDARLLRFAPSADGTIPGGHQDPKNKEFWRVGCLGITEPCSQV